jgi:hypothetical protein
VAAAPLRAISIEERRRRVGVRHRLARPARVDDDIAAIASSVVVLHATDPGSVVLAALARMRTPDPAAVERALYEERTVLRMLGMRRTVYTVPIDTAPIVQAAAADAVAVRERKKLIALLEATGVATDGARFLRRVERDTLAAVTELGSAAAAELAAHVPALATQMPLSEGKPYAGQVGVSSKVLFQLAAEGHLGRDRPRGAWTGSQHRWAPISRWIPDGLPTLDAGTARVELVRRWLDRFGPGTLADLKWWTGWGLGQTRAALAELATEEVDLGEVTGFVLAGDADAEPVAEPWVALLPALDATTMGWQERAWYLADEHRTQVFDRYGNAGPTVWADGRVVGGWAQRTSGEVVVRLLEDLGAAQTAAVAAEAARLQEALGPLRFVPRFRTPLERELSA